LCDVVSPHHNTSVKHAKDIAAGAVLICACGAVLTGLVTLMPYVWAYM
ncbi:MAG: diacylglycerol kinase family protein, partial [Lentisphaerae bacterium]|nr:diacylglycerol kinase family protein [Lentisphaerota bacterium]